jgi:hypothetical protein
LKEFGIDHAHFAERGSIGADIDGAGWECGEKECRETRAETEECFHRNRRKSGDPCVGAQVRKAAPKIR